ncbi:hypothetical protein N9M45_04820 [Euryarchaeota archaeon]|nr:hypothetical protein [Euryarchaeota archaeon]
MSDSVFSPDGKFMWTGSEWIPAPPTNHYREPLPSTSQSGDIRDSVIMGDVNRQITQNITYQASPISAEELALAISKAMEHSAGSAQNQSTSENGGELIAVKGMKIIEPSTVIFDSVYRKVSRFGRDTVIRDSLLFDCSIGGHNSISDSAIIGENVEIGNSVVMRDSVVANNAKIGNGCIVIESEIGEGVILPDNTYIEQKSVKNN